MGLAQDGFKYHRNFEYLTGTEYSTGTLSTQYTHLIVPYCCATICRYQEQHCYGYLNFGYINSMKEKKKKGEI